LNDAFKKLTVHSLKMEDIDLMGYITDYAANCEDRTKMLHMGVKGGPIDENDYDFCKTTIFRAVDEAEAFCDVAKGLLNLVIERNVNNGGTDTTDLPSNLRDECLSVIYLVSSIKEETAKMIKLSEEVFGQYPPPQ